MSTKIIINDRSFSFGISLKRERKKNTLPVFHARYTVLFLTLNILRLSQLCQGWVTNQCFGDLLYCHHNAV